MQKVRYGWEALLLYELPASPGEAFITLSPMLALVYMPRAFWMSHSTECVMVSGDLSRLQGSGSGMAELNAALAVH